MSPSRTTIVPNFADPIFSRWFKVALTFRADYGEFDFGRNNGKQNRSGGHYRDQPSQHCRYSRIRQLARWPMRQYGQPALGADGKLPVMASRSSQRLISSIKVQFGSIRHGQRGGPFMKWVLAYVPRGLPTASRFTVLRNSLGSPACAPQWGRANHYSPRSPVRRRKSVLHDAV